MKRLPTLASNPLRDPSVALPHTQTHRHTLTNARPRSRRTPFGPRRHGSSFLSLSLSLVFLVFLERKKYEEREEVVEEEENDDGDEGDNENDDDQLLLRFSPPSERRSRFAVDSGTPGEDAERRGRRVSRDAAERIHLRTTRSRLRRSSSGPGR